MIYFSNGANANKSVNSQEINQQINVFSIPGDYIY